MNAGVSSARGNPILEDERREGQASKQKTSLRRPKGGEGRVMKESMATRTNNVSILILLTEVLEVEHTLGKRPPVPGEGEGE